MKIEYVYIEVGHDTISNLEIIEASYNDYRYMLRRGCRFSPGLKITRPQLRLQEISTYSRGKERFANLN